MDLMSEVIRTVRGGRASGRLIRQSGPWGLRFADFDGGGFHLILRGTCWLITEDEEPLALAPGDVVLTSSDTAHGPSQVPCAMADPPPPLMDLMSYLISWRLSRGARLIR